MDKNVVYGNINKTKLSQDIEFYRDALAAQKENEVFSINTPVKCPVCKVTYRRRLKKDDYCSSNCIKIVKSLHKKLKNSGLLSLQ